MHRLRLLLLALLPGLLLSSGASLHVCLHQLLGLGADCASCTREESSCCGGAEHEEPGPRVVPLEECEACCVELETKEQRLASSLRVADVLAFGLELAPLPAPLVLLDVAECRTLASSSVGPRASPAARGLVLPLRI